VVETIITYETLYEIFRREKYRPELQQLDDKFFEDIRAYLKTKYAIFESQKNKTSIFASTELLKTQKQLENIKRLLDDLFEKRESKIMQIASSASKLNKEPDISIMLYQEKLLFKNLWEVFNKHKERILDSLDYLREEIKTSEYLALAETSLEVPPSLDEQPRNEVRGAQSSEVGQVPQYNGKFEWQKTEGKFIEPGPSTKSAQVTCEDGLKPKAISPLEERKTEGVRRIEDEDARSETRAPQSDEVGHLLKQSECDLQSKVMPHQLSESLLNQGGNSIPKEDLQEDTLRLIRILAPIPSFIGPDFKVYGPFESEDITNIPKVIANILIAENRAKEIKVNI